MDCRIGEGMPKKLFGAFVQEGSDILLPVLAEFIGKNILILIFLNLEVETLLELMFG